MMYPEGRLIVSVVKYVIFFNIFATVTHLTSTGVGVTTFGYNNRSLQTTTTLANGVIEAKAYDADSQLLSMELAKGETFLYKRTQSYNLVGDVTQRGTSSNGAALTLENFTYDPVSRLTEHKTDAGNQSLNSYGYNTVGNLVTIGNKNQTYDTAGKVTSTGSTDVTYDARNNRTTLVGMVDASKNVEYTWAHNNLLASVTTHDEVTPSTVAYTYSADNLLQTQTEGASTEQFVWDTSREIPAMLSDGKYEYVYSQDRVPLAQIEIATGTVTYLHKDLTGSVTASTDATGGLVGTVDYSPYGVATGSALSHFGYAGEWVDITTGYSYLKARWLDTLTGTFLSEDPLVHMTNNAFGYTEGNPITQIDPFGLMTLLADKTAWDTGFKKMGEALYEVGKWTVENSGTISSVFALAAVTATATGVGAPVGAVLGLISLGFGIVGAGYETAKCSGYIKDKECDPLQLTLSILSATTGGVAGLVGKIAIPSVTTSKITTGVASGLGKTSNVTGVSGTSISAGGVETTIEEKECK